MQRRSGGRGLGAVLFTDIVGSTAIAAEMGDTRWLELVARHHRIVRHLIAGHGGREVDTAGDGFFAIFERPADAIRCAVDATEGVRELGIEIRAGVAFGEVEMGDRKPGGLVVNTAARVMAVAGPGEVLVPASVREIVPGSGITFAEHGVHRLKGLEDEFRLFIVTGIDGHDVAPPLEADEAVERRREIFPTAARRGALMLGLGVGLVAVVIGAVVLLSGDRAQPTRERGPLANAVVRIDTESGATGSPIELPDVEGYDAILGFVDHPMAAGEGAVWLLHPPLLLHVDPLHGEVRSERMHVGFASSQTVDTGFDSVWAAADGRVFRVNPATDELDTALVLPGVGGITTYTFTVSTDAIWAATSNGQLVRLDPRTRQQSEADTGLTIDRITATRGSVWASDVLAGAIQRIDASSLRPVGQPIQVGGGIDQLVALDDSVWVLDRRVGLVTRIDAASGETRGSVRVGDRATDMAVGLGGVWVGDREGAVYRVDASTLEAEPIRIGAEVLGVAVDEASGAVWAYVGAPVTSG